MSWDIECGSKWHDRWADTSAKQPSHALMHWRMPASKQALTCVHMRDRTHRDTCEAAPTMVLRSATSMNTPMTDVHMR